MGVYIKGMEMPGDCFKCPLMTDYGTCGFYALYTDRSELEASWEKRPNDCPLVEVPKHGRLIDADALKARLFPEEIDGIKTSITVSCMKLVIDDAPTIIPASEEE